MSPPARPSRRSASSATTLQGRPNKIGPQLYGVVGRARATHPGFDYSSAMKAKGGSWTYDELFKYLKSPGSYVPGTKMSFAGLRSEQDRINLIAFLRTNADSPAAIPAPAPEDRRARGAAAGCPARRCRAPTAGCRSGCRQALPTSADRQAAAPAAAPAPTSSRAAKK